MQRSRRLSIALAVLAVVFLAVSGHAVATLLMLGDPVLAAVAVLAGVVCVGVTALTWWIARDLETEEADAVQDEPSIEAAAPQAFAMQAVMRPLKVQALPVAELPAPYVAAVMKGTKANRDLYKARSTQY